MVDRSYPPYAYDDDLLEAARRDRQTRVRIYRLTDTVAVLGSGSRPEVELDLDACEEDNVPILRRRGGGCSVILDPGNVIVSVVATGQPFGRYRQAFDTLTDWLIDGLARCGMPGISQAGICDLVVGDKKVAGACAGEARRNVSPKPWASRLSSSNLRPPPLDAESLPRPERLPSGARPWTVQSKAEGVPLAMARTAPSLPA